MDHRTLTWRALPTEDVPALTRACAAVEAVDHTAEHYSERDVRDELEDASIDRRRDSLAALVPDGEIAAFTWVRGSVEVHDLDRIDAEAAVAPAARRRGLGCRLLDGAEERAARLHAERHSGFPEAVCVDVHENNAGKQALVQAAGYEATRWWYTADRDEAVREAHREAFAGQWGATPAGYERSVLTAGTGNPTGALRLYERVGYALKDTSVVWTKPL